MKIKIPESIRFRNEYKRKFSLYELYRAYLYAPRAIAGLIRNKKSKMLENQFIERLHLAVTEVNGCAACSYAHTRMALNKGMSNEEITAILNGDDTVIKPEEAKAIMFAQHFADTRGYPHRETYDEIVREYSVEKAEVILSAVQLMMVGNMYGIPYSAFLSRLKGRAYKDSSLFYEVWMLTAGSLCLPVALVHSLLLLIIGRPKVRFGTYLNKSLDNINNKHTDTLRKLAK